ncbi:hypothetical protein BKA63DRAFT_501065 [Paraphoma chrysanthemicola]|nr:hypothetical protein BKA63DRAFT_501065 [Paraphoma chrysanthemicola]
MASAKTPLVPIARGRSSPGSSDRQSFLTTLPPEIRNRIYESLFVYEYPVEATVHDQYGVEKPCNFLLPSRTSTDANRKARATRLQVPNTRYNLACAMPFLRTCRQIYHEAVGVCYSQNSFTFYPFHHDELKLSAWVEAISTQVHMVKKLAIDLEALNTSSRREYSGQFRRFREFDILPVLRIIWFSVSPQAEVYLHHDAATEESGFYPWVNIIALDKAIHSITQGDSLALRRFARIPGALAEVFVEDNVTQGYFRYGSTYGAGSRRETFTVSDNGNHVQLDPDQREIRFFDGGDIVYTYSRRREVGPGTKHLPRDAYGTILRYVLDVPHEIQVDLSGTTRSYVEMACNPLLHVSTQLRLDSVRHFLAINCFNLIYTSETTRTNLEKARAINDCPLLLPRPKVHRGNTIVGEPSFADIRDEFNIFSAKKISFTFDFRPLHNAVELYDVRISILGFLRETTNASRPFIIYCRSFTPQHQSEPGEVNIFSSCILRMRVFIALSHLLWAKPWRKDHVCPDICINGYGFAVEMKKVGSKHYQEIPGGMDLLAQQVEPFKEGCKFARIIGKLAVRPQRLFRDLGPILTPKSTLIEVWAYLRDEQGLGSRMAV